MLLVVTPVPRPVRHTIAAVTTVATSATTPRDMGAIPHGETTTTMTLLRVHYTVLVQQPTTATLGGDNDAGAHASTAGTSPSAADDAAAVLEVVRAAFSRPGALSFGSTPASAETNSDATAEVRDVRWVYDGVWSSQRAPVAASASATAPPSLNATTSTITARSPWRACGFDVEVAVAMTAADAGATTTGAAVSNGLNVVVNVPLSVAVDVAAVAVRHATLMTANTVGSGAAAAHLAIRRQFLVSNAADAATRAHAEEAATVAATTAKRGSGPGELGAFTVTSADL
jgi:hypothetical protein